MVLDKKYSTSLALVDLMETTLNHWKKKNIYIFVVLIDLRKAFDTTNHSMLLKS